MKCKCEKEDLSGLHVTAGVISETGTHSAERCYSNGKITQGALNYVKPYHVEKFDHPLNVPEGTMFSNVPETDPKVIRQQMLDGIKTSQKYIQSVLDNKTTIYGNKWDGNQFKEVNYQFPSYADFCKAATTSKDHKEFIPGAKYTEKDISRIKDESYRNGYGVGYEKGLEKGRFSVRCLSSTYSDYILTKAHVEKSEEYWADGIDPDEP